MRQGSSSMTPKSSCNTHRYCVRAPTAQVDETLFGNTTPISQLDKHGNSASKAENLSHKNQEVASVQIITKDLIRNLRIPYKDPVGASIILPSAEFERITSKSQVLTKEERVALQEAHRRKKYEEIMAAEERKRQIYEADLSRKENKALTELEIEARDRAQRLVEKASALRMEQEEEIQKLNKLILGAQCQATCEVQICEKKQIQAELREEEKRLDAMMEVERRKELETVEQIDKLRKKQTISGMQKIYDQIQQRFEDRRLQDAIKEQEKQHVRETEEKMKLEDLKALEKRREEQKRMQDEIISVNAETVRAKQQRREEEKLADMRDMEYIRKKMEREANYEAEQKRIRQEKELEIARLRARQGKAKDYKEEQDELRIRRDREKAEKEWRRKEKELVRKKAQDEALLRAARLEQVHCKERSLRIKKEHKKAETVRMLKAEQEAIAKQEEEEKEKQRQRAHRYSEALRNQVKAHELSAAAKRREILKEAHQELEKTQQAQRRLEEVKERKLRELRATGLSEKYCREVERKARACST